MSLTSVNDIERTVGYDPRGFSFLSTVNDLVGNLEYSRGSRAALDGVDDHSTFYWRALSAAGSEMADTVYENVRHYIQCVADVDTCKLTALRSMLKLFNYKATVLDNFLAFPVEVLRLVDVLSIDKKYLKEAGFAARGLLADLAAEGVVGRRDGAYRANFRDESTDCSLTLSADELGGSMRRLLGAYSGCAPVQSLSAGWALRALSDPFLAPQLSSANVYWNANGCRLVDARPADPAAADGLWVLSSPSSADVSSSFVMRLSPDGGVFSLPGESFAQQVSSLCAMGYCDEAFARDHASAAVSLGLSAPGAGQDLDVFDDDGYRLYVKGLFRNLLYGHVAGQYNLSATYMTHTLPVYVYPYLGDKYYRDVRDGSRQKYVNYENDDMLSVKVLNHVGQFNEKAIYDRIELGEDSLGNYSGAQLQLLLMERDRRAQPLSPGMMTLPAGYSTSNLTHRQDQTRYSYYREQKVLEYANFVDRYYSAMNADGGAEVYDFDPNYWEIGGAAVADQVIRRPADIGRPKPSTDIRMDMVDAVAEHLADATQYVCKLRREIKLQTQKNYMRGTNLLLIYIVNEYLRDYARHNSATSADPLGGDDPAIRSVRDALANHPLDGSSHQGYSVDVREYWDGTEYFNLATDSSGRAELSGKVNARFWDGLNSIGEGAMDGDGASFKLAEIERFYLSALGMSEAVSGDLQSFLSVIYDMGADNSFVAPGADGEPVFSGVLEDGRQSMDVYARLVDLSTSYGELMESYISGGYQFPQGTVEEQLSGALSSYVYPNLSSTFMTGLSDVYNIYMPKAEELCASVESIRQAYVRFVTQTYGFYYVKSECKYCYADYDYQTGAYNMPYFVGHPDYDSETMSLYEHLYQLCAYTNEQTIRNFALLQTIDYLDGALADQRQDLSRKVISPLATDYGFQDIDAASMDAELQYVDGYVRGLIEDRQQLLKNQLASLQQQANSLKSAYDNLNNTFTNAVAQFNDNNPGYKLGDSSVRWFTSFTEDVEGAARRSESEGPPKKSKQGVTFVRELGYWYYLDEDGSYGFGSTSPSTAYDPTAPLAARAQAVKDYMNCPTSKTPDGFNYGLMSDGIMVVCDNVLQGIDDMKGQFSAIAAMAEQLYGLDKPGADDLYANIQDLVEKLLQVDESQFQYDEKLRNLNSYRIAVVRVSADYQPVKSEYNRIFFDAKQVAYLSEFQKPDGLTRDGLAEMKAFAEKTDRKNLAEIQEALRVFIEEDFQQAASRKRALEAECEEAGVDGARPRAGTALEADIAQLAALLSADAAAKTEKALAQVDHHKELITDMYGEGYADVVLAECSADLSSDKPFRQAASEAIARLNFFQHRQYEDRKGLYMTYGGRDFCYDPYYNMKNATHPSYQVHPYLWNFAQKIPTATLIEAGFRSEAVGYLARQQARLNLQKWVGRCGQTVDAWERSNDGLIDYSGYRSMYERESNYSKKLNRVNEVVDYEGAFYPPALEYYLAHPAQAGRAVSEMRTRYDVFAKCVAALSNDITSYVQARNGKPVVPPGGGRNGFSDAIYGVASAYYATEAECTFNRRLNEYLALPTTYISSLSWADVHKAVFDGLPETFYGKYYSQVELTEGEAARVACQLAEYYDDIKELCSDKPEAEQYDVYRYGIDVNKTHYVLYKKYGKDAPTFQERRDALGSLWIRLGDHPIAFPAFHGSDPAYYIRQPSQLSRFVQKLAERDDPGITWLDREKTEIVRIDSQVRAFYDFEIAQNGASLALMAFDPLLGNDEKFFVQYRLANVAAAPVDVYYDRDADVTYLKFCNAAADGLTTVDYLEFHRNSSNGYSSASDLSSVEAAEAGVRYPALVGHHVFDNTSINFVYAYETFRLSGGEDATEISPEGEGVQYFVYKVDNGTSFRKVPSSGVADVDLGGRRVVGGSMCAGYDQRRQKLTLAFATEPAPAAVPETTSGRALDMVAAADGAAVGDPLAVETNSHDMFEQNVTLAEVQYQARGLVQSKTYDYNLNADISYTPVYPGRDYMFDMPAKGGVLSDEYHNIELLGSSKDIEGYIGLVNPDPDPYFDYDKIFEDEQFGRVYEDYMREYDKTFTQTSNPSLNFNAPSRPSRADIVTKGPTSLEWTVLLNRLNHVPFNQHDVGTMRVMIYNSGTLGKNPYYVGTLADLLSGETALAYSEARPGGELDAELSTKCKVPSGEVKATGTHSDIAMHDRRDSNRIDMVAKVTAQAYAPPASPDAWSLTVKFYLDPAAPLMKYAHVDAGSIKVVLYNDKDLETYKYYHMLDALGAVQCRYIDNLRPEDNDTWGVYIVGAKTARHPYSSFYEDEQGVRRYLDELELSGYDGLSDVYVFRGNKMLGFKNDEAYRFPVSSDLYYYPTLNYAYPRLAADHVGRNMPFSEYVDNMRGIFGGGNLFVIRPEDPGRIADAIGQVDIPVLYNDVDDVRAHEDWLSSQVVDGQTVDNYSLYDAADPRSAQFLHFTSGGSAEPAGGYDVPDESVSGKDMDRFSEDFAAQHGCTLAKSGQEGRGLDFAYVTTTVKKSVCDLGRLLDIYVNWRSNPSDGSIELYFNYFNYLDTPYVRLEDGTRLMADTIRSTYLKLAAGEDGPLDIIVQFRHYVGPTLVGYSNVKVLSYRMYNISDDKPKFLMQKTYEIQPGAARAAKEPANVQFVVDKLEYRLDEYAPADKISGVIGVSVFSDKALYNDWSKFRPGFYLSYPGNLLDVDASQSGAGWAANSSKSAAGYLYVEIRNTDVRRFEIAFETKQTAAQLTARYANRRFDVSVEDPELKDKDGLAVEPAADASSISFINTTLNVLGARTAAAAQSSAYVVDTADDTLFKV